MQKKIQIKVPVPQATDEVVIRDLLANEAGSVPGNINGYQILKRSLDARSRYPFILLTVSVFIGEPAHPRKLFEQTNPDLSDATKSVLIIGAGPAGLFAALSLIRSGIRPIIIERGKDIRSRRRDLATLNKEGILNPESNYCFGKEVRALTVMVNCIPAVIKEEISKEFWIFLSGSVQKKIFYMKLIPILAPINCPASFRLYGNT